MFFAVIGDIQGNFSALQQVISDINDRGIYTVLHTGNVVGGSKNGDEILNLLDKYRVKMVQGNEDKMLSRFEKKKKTLINKLEPGQYRNLESSASTLSGDTLERLRSTPAMIDLTLEGIHIALCHGLPSGQKKELSPDISPLKLQREREIVNAEVIICGGSAEVFHCFEGETLFASPGILKQNDNRAGYIIINTESDPWSVEQVLLTLAH